MSEGQERVEGQVWGGEVNFKGGVGGVGEYWVEEGDIVRREEQPPAERGKVLWHNIQYMAAKLKVEDRSTV